MNKRLKALDAKSAQEGLVLTEALVALEKANSRTKRKSPQTNDICERFHETVLNEFYRLAFRKKVYRTIDELQADLDVWVRE